MEPYEFTVHYHIAIPVRDGLRLSANLWLPTARQAGERFPVVLEMIPYRKDDWRFPADHARMSYLAARGFAGCRLDIRGTGSSPGIARDEYTPAETQDGYDAVEWLAAQPWCSGSAGMWGISYGGFTAIQVAALAPPSLKAIVPMYATDDRYTDDVHYIGGCVTASEKAQYALAQQAMNAMPPRAEYVGPAWAELWRERLEQTPPWLIEWLRQQADGPYWRSGSLAPDYARIRCAILHIAGWADGYTNPALRMQERCSAPRRTIIGPWVHSLPDSAYPGPNIDWLHELARFFGHWLRGDENGVMDEPALTVFREEYTPPAAFPAQKNGAWHSEAAYPIARAAALAFELGDGELLGLPSASRLPPAGIDRLPHRATHGTRAALCYGAGSAPNGLSRDLRPDEALSLTYTSAPLDTHLDIIGFPAAELFVSCDAPLANLVLRLCDVAPDGTSAQVCVGILNLSHRDGHTEPQPLEPGRIYPVRVGLKACGYRFLPGHRVRLSVASGYWPVIWPSPYPCTISLHRGPDTPARLLLPAVPPADTPAPPAFRTEPPALDWPGAGSEEPPVWRIVEDVIAGTTSVEIAGGDSTELPFGTSLRTSEHIVLTARDADPAHALLRNEVVYTLSELGAISEIRTSGGVRSTADSFHVDIQLVVSLNGHEFFRRAWLESIPRNCV